MKNKWKGLQLRMKNDSKNYKGTKKNNRNLQESKTNSSKLRKTLNGILLIIAILIIIVLIVLIQINKRKTTKMTVSNETREQIEQKNENAITGNITQMSEEDRVEAYVGQFISAIEEKDYDKAYAKLNENFKNNYFKTLEDFKNYAEKKYPSNPSITYDSLKRIGQIYLVQVTIKDVMNTDFNAFSQRFVIRENGANDYKVSFQAD